jgi:hypothetical protein
MAPLKMPSEQKYKFNGNNAILLKYTEVETVSEKQYCKFLNTLRSQTAFSCP